MRRFLVGVAGSVNTEPRTRALPPRSSRPCSADGSPQPNLPKNAAFDDDGRAILTVAKAAHLERPPPFVADGQVASPTARRRQQLPERWGLPHRGTGKMLAWVNY